VKVKGADLQWVVAVAAVVFRAGEQHPATRDEQDMRRVEAEREQQRLL